MKFGVCTGIEKYSELVDMGYDYIELAGSSIYKMTEDEFLKTRHTINNGPIKCPGFNAFLSPDVKVIGDGVDMERLREYVDMVVVRASQLGVKAIGFGSPASRMVPDGFSKEKAYTQALDFVEMALEKAEPYGIKILIESLASAETNFINTVKEAYKFMKQLKHKNTGLVLDLYHFWKENEDISVIDDEIMKHVVHVHIAEEKGRVSLIERKYEKYREYIKKFKDLGYDDKLSFEGVIKDFTPEVKETLRILRELDKE